MVSYVPFTRTLLYSTPERGIDGVGEFNAPLVLYCASAPQCGNADAEIKDPSFENPELKGSPSKALGGGGSEHSLACFAYCQESLPC